MPYVWRNWFRSAFERAFKLVHLFIICLLLFLSALLFILFFLYVYVTKYNLIASHLVEFRRSSLSHWCGRDVIRGLCSWFSWLMVLGGYRWLRHRGGRSRNHKGAVNGHPPHSDGKWCVDISVPLITRDRLDWRWQTTTIIQRSALTTRNEGASKTRCIWYSTDL